MGSFVKKFLLLFIALPLFAQSEVVKDREQGWVTGDPFWRQALGGAVLSLPDVQAQSAVVALDGGNIRAYSTAGKPLWDYSAKGKISPFVTRSREGTSYFSRTNGVFIAVNRAGRELWRRNLGKPLTAKAVTGWDGRLFVPTEKRISCFTASGNLLWALTFESPFSIAPRLDHGGGIFFTLENNEAWRIDPFSNFQKWTLTVKPAAVLSVGQQILAVHKDGSMEVLGSFQDWYISAQSVNLKPLPKFSSAPMAVVSRGSDIAAVFSDGRAALASLDEGKIVWSGDTHIREIIKGGGKAETESEMLFDERGIYILSKDGATGFTKDGRRLWYTILKNAAAVPAFGSDGVLYSGGRDWILYAYKLEDRSLPEKRRLYGPDPEGAYGTGKPLSNEDLLFFPFEYDVKAKLDEINSAVNAGKVGINEPAWMSWLQAVAGGQCPIQHRAASLRLLGIIGSQETIPWLVNLFRKELDPSVRAAAALAIGAIGVDPDGAAINVFLETVTRASGLLMKDEQVLIALTQATGALCRFSGPPLSETGVKILTILSSNSQLPLVKRQAEREIVSLR
ncbi:MAG: PQQ-like beta-propeller repeat protein [Treponema sp.]|jgi:outer membrane protein assembly factor BamB|nr:PQQ-like beta-propeller repeat protein [Treponema sp.]